MKTKFTSMKTQLTTLHNDSVVQTNMNTMKMTNAMRMKLLCLATFAMAMTAAHLTAQTFTTLHSFTNADGALPQAVILSGKTLYGTTYQGGKYGYGVVFAVNNDGTGFTNLHSLNGGSDGGNPYAGVTLSGNILYGTASYGGSSDEGTVFKVNTDGTDFTPLLSFTGANDEAYPETGLLLSGNTLYGASGGPGSTSGALFALNTNGTPFTTLHVFSPISGAQTTNSDGASVFGNDALVLSGNTLYATAEIGGTNGTGTIFAVNTSGMGFTVLHSFAPVVGTSPYSNPPYTNSEGAFPDSGLVLSGNTLYGTATVGGTNGGTGTIFAINTNGTGFTTLYSFTATAGSQGGYGTNSDGAYPSYVTLILSGNTLYGTTLYGGSAGNGTVFAVNTDGSGFTVLHSFTSGSGSGPNIINSDGTEPDSLVLSGNTLYGTAYEGGSSGNGTVFSLSFPPPQLHLISSGPYVSLTWPTNYAGFSYSGYILQSTTNLVSPVWGTVSPGPVVVNGQNTVTNPVSGTQQFFRLNSP